MQKSRVPQKTQKTESRKKQIPGIKFQKFLGNESHNSPNSQLGNPLFRLGFPRFPRVPFGIHSQSFPKF